jgi:osmoprotectant transport system ATP-binding protein
VTTGAGATIRFRDVVVRYPDSDRNAVDGVDLAIAAGEFVVLLGPSGCGKSTLLRTVNALVTPHSGSVELDGADVRSQQPETLRRGIGYVIQAVGLFPHMTIAENVGIVPQLLGWENARVAARVDELLAMVALDPARYRGRRPRELSGGEQQRVGVARALAAEPRALLMDEPFGAVDAIVRQSLQDQTVRIHRELGTTIVFVTHDVDEALRVADRIVVMRAGKIEQSATPLEILSNPATPYVAELLDAKDVVRRLQLLRARDALLRARDALSRAGEQHERRNSTDAGTHDDAQPSAAREFPSVSANATLRETLSTFLLGNDRVAVVDGEHRLGTITFDDLRRALGTHERAA